MTRLLVSVRSPSEAAAALAGGAALIDVKEPANGALGRATDATLAAIIDVVHGLCPVSAALGEWSEATGQLPTQCGLSYLKWGFSGSHRAWTEESARVATALNRLRAERPLCGLVIVAYADWRNADAPPPAELCRFACDGRWGPFLIDTCRKDGTTLLDHLPLKEIAALVERCRTADIPIALAGSISKDAMQTLLPLAPDWFGVRGAVCKGGRRSSAIDEDAVRRLVEWLSTSCEG